MTLDYNAWDEFDPDLGKVLRAAVASGDWSLFALVDPATAQALEAAVEHNDWDQFDPSVARALRAAIAQERATAKTEAERAADNDLAKDRARLAAKYPDFKENEAAILDLAIKHGIGDLEIGYKTWRGPAGPAKSATAQAPNAVQQSIDQKQARLDSLKFKSDSDALTEKRHLKEEIRDLVDQSAVDDLKARNGSDVVRQRWLEEANEDETAHQKGRREAGYRGGPRHSKEAQRKVLDIEVLDSFRSGKPIQSPKTRSRQDRDADGLNADDKQVVAALRATNAAERQAGGPPIANPNAESVVSSVVNE